jgi:hypothetical protein
MRTRRGVRKRGKTGGKKAAYVVFLLHSHCRPPPDTSSRSPVSPLSAAEEPWMDRDPMMPRSSSDRAAFRARERGSSAHSPPQYNSQAIPLRNSVPEGGRKGGKGEWSSTLLPPFRFFVSPLKKKEERGEEGRESSGLSRDSGGDRKVCPFSQTKLKQPKARQVLLFCDQ